MSFPKAPNIWGLKKNALAPTNENWIFKLIISTFKLLKVLSNFYTWKNSYLVNDTVYFSTFYKKWGRACLLGLRSTKDRRGPGHTGSGCNPEGNWEPLLGAGKCSLWLQWGEWLGGGPGWRPSSSRPDSRLQPPDCRTASAECQEDRTIALYSPVIFWFLQPQSDSAF